MTGQPDRGRRSRPALVENVAAIKAWEKTLLHGRSRAEQISDWITRIAATGPVLLLHVAWFLVWIALNMGAIPNVKPFDPFPFPFLTMVVSLEAIFLALLVLASQSRLSRQSDRRALLDLEIDLLAEREMTAVLQLLLDIAAKLEVEGTVTRAQIRDLASKTDFHKLTEKVEELAEENLSDRPDRKAPKAAAS